MADPLTTEFPDHVDVISRARKGGMNDDIILKVLREETAPRLGGGGKFRMIRGGGEASFEPPSLVENVGSFIGDVGDRMLGNMENIGGMITSLGDNLKTFPAPPPSKPFTGTIEVAGGLLGLTGIPQLETLTIGIVEAIVGEATEKATGSETAGDAAELATAVTTPFAVLKLASKFPKIARALDPIGDVAKGVKDEFLGGLERSKAPLQRPPSATPLESLGRRVQQASDTVQASPAATRDAFKIETQTLLTEHKAKLLRDYQRNILSGQPIEDIGGEIKLIDDVLSRKQFKAGTEFMLDKGTTGKVKEVLPNGDFSVVVRNQFGTVGTRVIPKDVIKDISVRGVISEPGTFVDSGLSIGEVKGNSLSRATDDALLNENSTDIDSINTTIGEVGIGDDTIDYLKKTGDRGLPDAQQYAEAAMRKTVDDLSQELKKLTGTPIDMEKIFDDFTIGEIDPQKFKGDIGLLGEARPFYSTAATFQKRTGIPTFDALAVNGRRAINQDINFISQFDAVKAEIFKDFNGEGFLSRSPENVAAREKVTDVVEMVDSVDSVKGTVTFTKELGGVKQTVPINKFHERVNVEPRIAKAAVNLRRAYDRFIDMGALGAEGTKFKRERYSPRILNMMRDFNMTDSMFKDRADIEAFFEKRRTKDIDGTEERDALALFNGYINAWGNAKIMRPWFNQSAKPVLDAIKAAGGEATEGARYFEEYVRLARKMPTEKAAHQNEKIGRWIDTIWQTQRIQNAIGDGSLKANALETIYNHLNDKRVAERLASSVAGWSAKSFLGFRQIASARNLTQRFWSIPLIPREPGEITTIQKLFQRYPRGSLGYKRAQAAGIFGNPIDEVAQTASENIVSQWALRTFSAADKSNRLVIYNSIHDHIVKAFKAGRSFDQVKRELHLNLYHPVEQKRFEELWKLGSVGNVEDVGLANNAAHYLADAAQIKTQFPYERGGAARLLNRSPLRKSLTTFQSWMLNSSDYLAGVAWQTLKGTFKEDGAGNWLRLGKMFATLAAIDGAYSALYGENPRFFQALGGPKTLGVTPALGQFSSIRGQPASLAAGNLALSPAAAGATGLAFGVAGLAADKYYQNLSDEREESYAKRMASRQFIDAAWSVGIFISGPVGGGGLQLKQTLDAITGDTGSSRRRRTRSRSR